MKKASLSGPIKCQIYCCFSFYGKFEKRCTFLNSLKQKKLQQARTESEASEYPCESKSYSKPNLLMAISEALKSENVDPNEVTFRALPSFNNCQFFVRFRLIKALDWILRNFVNIISSCQPGFSGFKAEAESIPRYSPLIKSALHKIGSKSHLPSLH